MEIGERLANCFQIGMRLRVGIHVLLQLIANLAARRADASVCVGAGRRVSVSGCANIADTVQRYMPPPADYAPLPEDTPPPAPPP